MPSRSPEPRCIVTRRELLALGAAAALLPAVSRAKTSAPSTSSGEMTTTGGMRPGPVGFTQPAVRPAGIPPAEIKSDTAQIDAQVETQLIVNGRMQNPSGPFIAAWYKETGKLGAVGNIVIAGHLDYWNVPQAVFYRLNELNAGDIVTVVGADDQSYRYAVEWKKNYKLAELDAAGIQEIVGATDTEQLTLITCGGPFDSSKGEYLERTVVRSSRQR